MAENKIPTGGDPFEKAKLDELQNKFGYFFNNLNLLKEALTHKSFFNENPAGYKDSERLAFLGDATLDCIIGDLLYKKYPDFSEGRLTVFRASLVNTDSLSVIADNFGISCCILLGHGEEATGGRAKKSILVETYQAIIGGVYFDGGYEKVYSLVEKHFSNLIAKAAADKISRDYKSKLQQYSQSKFGVIPEYKIINAAGPDHGKIFEVQVVINGKTYQKGSGSNKKIAEQEAARKTLEALMTKE
jgi:ribonuclease III